MNAESFITQVQKNTQKNTATPSSNSTSITTKKLVETTNKVKKKCFFSIFYRCFANHTQDQKKSIQSSNTIHNLNNHLVESNDIHQTSKRKTLVLDLDETLVHSSFKPEDKIDYVIPIHLDDQIHQVFVKKRPHVDTFLHKMSALYDIIIFTASLSNYADPLLDLLDKHKVVQQRLFREACVRHEGNYVKDLSTLGKGLESTIIIDNSPICYMFNPENAIPIESWFDDENDTELLDMIPLLEKLAKVTDVRSELEAMKRTI